ncbi:hypothetical protein AX15_003728 [Amanita polypyramis BW_CC]|nr:hypothetical protein AX15_003728 [Amanita polypyramis BW_CC]
MMPTGCPTSKLSSPHQAVATLLLIENSSPMSTIWHVFRDRYLPSILRKIGRPSSAHSTFFIESSSLSPGLTVPPQFKVYRGCASELEFDCDPSNTISLEKIYNSLDLLTSMAIQALPVALHLIIVAASTPLNDYPNYMNQPSPWLRLSERMAQEDVNCHLVLRCDLDTCPFKFLFEETLRLRRRHEVPPPFSINPTEAIVRLTETRGSSPGLEAIDTGVPRQPSPARRTRTYPIDEKSYDVYSSTLQTHSELPSLVTQLQQRHGLTKKKVYGIKPPRAPFFRDREDPPFDPFRRAVLPFTASLTDLSLTSSITMTPGGRSAPLSKLDRMARLSHRSPTDSSSRRWHPSASRLSSPEIDATAVSSSILTTDTMRPTNYEHPVTPTPAPIQPAKLPCNMPLRRDQHMGYSQTVYEPDTGSHWSTPQNGYVPHDYSVVSQPQPYGESYAHSPPTDVYTRQTADGQSSPSTYTPTINPVVQESPTPYRDPVTNSNSSPQDSHSASSKATPSNLKDDEPFTFDPEYIAATAVMFRQEVLPAYPEYPELAESYGPSNRSDSTLYQGYSLGCDHYSMLPYLPPNKAGQLYALKYSVGTPRLVPESNLAFPSTSDYASTTSRLSHVPAYSMGTSSLTGWAG